MRDVALAATLAAALAAGASGSAVPLVGVERDVFLMGTRARFQAYGRTRAIALDTLERAISILESTEDELSTWRDHSAISAFNRQAPGVPWQAGPDLCVAFRTLFRWHAATGGAFDPAIGRLTDAWDIHGVGRVPAPDVLDLARRNSGLHLIDFDRQACTLTRTADVRVDVGAWGKGDGLDRVQHALPDRTWMIDFGGQIAVNGLPPAQSAWTLSLAHPTARQRPVMTISLRGGSLSTSAGSERDLVVDGRRVAHHLNPHTGEPVTFRGSVTVWHPSALAADVLSTALYVMGPEKGARWAEANHIAACYIIPHGKDDVDVQTTTEFRLARLGRILRRVP